VYTVQNKDLKKFSEEAKRYGVLYCVLKDKNDKSDTGIVDVIARAEDASKIQRITERFKLATVDTATVMGDITSKDRLFPSNEKMVKDKLSEVKTTKEAGTKLNPSQAKTGKDPLSEPSLRQESLSNGSMTGQTSKPSVREKLNDYKTVSLKEKENKRVEKAKAAKAGVSVPAPKPTKKER
jgi:Icc-related predicted phosphoesterase